MKAIPAGMAADPLMGQGSTSHASKRCRLVRIVDDDNEEDKTALPWSGGHAAAQTSRRATLVG